MTNTRFCRSDWYTAVVLRRNGGPRIHGGTATAGKGRIHGDGGLRGDGRGGSEQEAIDTSLARSPSLRKSMDRHFLVRQRLGI